MRRQKSKTNTNQPKVQSISPNTRNLAARSGDKTNAGYAYCDNFATSTSAAGRMIRQNQQQVNEAKSGEPNSEDQQVDLKNEQRMVANSQIDIGSGLLQASPIRCAPIAQNVQPLMLHKLQQQKGNFVDMLHSESQQIVTTQPHLHLAVNAMQQKYEVYMRCVTWSRDSHGLFDYESKNIAKKNIKTQTGGKILRVNDDVEFVSIRTKPEEVDNNAKPMIIVRQTNGQFQVQNDTLVAVTPRDQEGNPITDEDINNKMFVVVRNTKSAQNNLDYKLGRGDIIKLGRIKFNVKDYNHRAARGSSCKKDVNHFNAAKSPEKRPIDPLRGPDGDGSAEHQYCSDLMAESTPGKQACQQLKLDHSRDSLQDEFEEEAVEIDCGVVDPKSCPDIQCKVCWDNSSTPENPLLNSCQCDGSVRYIHYECLKYWLKQKMAKKEEPNLISYTWKQFECEICKKPYPYVFKSNGLSYRLVDVEADLPDDKNYLLLESLTFEKNSSRMVHLIMPDSEKKIFKLGRGHESDVRVSDISVSRCHALVKYNAENGRFYLEDNLSKFGTLVLAKSSISLEPEMTKAVQIGRSVISFTVKPYQPAQAPAAPVQPAIQNMPVKTKQSPYKTPSPQRFKHDEQTVSQVRNTQMQVEEILRKRIEETNVKINQLMQTALANGSSAGNKNETAKRDRSANRCETEGDQQPVSSAGCQLQGLLDLQQVTGKNTSLNLDHLLRATNHLKIAQNEFELAKKQLLSEAVANGASSELLAQLSAPTFGRQSSYEPAMQQHHDYLQMNGLQRQMSHQVKHTSQKKSYSDQKTPTSGNGQPNSFLYRAHINLNEIQDQPSYPQQNSLQICHQPTRYVNGNNHHQIGEPARSSNISSFYEEASDLEENKELESAFQYVPGQSAHFGDSQPLRIPGGKLASPTRGSDNAPIMQIMKLHKQMSDQKQSNEHQTNKSRQNLVSQDEMLAAQAQLSELGIHASQQQDLFSASKQNAQQARGKSASDTIGASQSSISSNCASRQSHQRVHHQAHPIFKKNPSSPSKIFQKFSAASQQSQSRSPFRGSSNGFDSRDHSEGGVTSTSLGPNNSKQMTGSTMNSSGYAAGRMLNISPVKSKANIAAGLKSCITEYKEDGQQEAQNSLQSVHQRLREYQGSHGTASVSKALFQGGAPASPTGGDQMIASQAPQLQSKTASAFGQSLRF